LGPSSGIPQAVEDEWDELLMASFDREEGGQVAQGTLTQGTLADDGAIHAAEGTPAGAEDGRHPCARGRTGGPPREDDVIQAAAVAPAAAERGDDVMEAGGGAAAAPSDSDDDVIEVTGGAVPRSMRARNAHERSMLEASLLPQPSLPHSSSHPALTLPHSLPHSLHGSLSHSLSDTDHALLYHVPFYACDWPAQAYTEADPSGSKLLKAEGPDWGSWAHWGLTGGVPHASLDLGLRTGAHPSPTGIDGFRAGLTHWGAWAHTGGAPGVPCASAGVGRRDGGQLQRVPSGVPQAGETPPVPTPTPTSAPAPTPAPASVSRMGQMLKGQRGKLKGVPVSRVRPPGCAQGPVLPAPEPRAALGAPTSEHSLAAQAHQGGPEPPAAGVPAAKHPGTGSPHQDARPLPGSVPVAGAALGEAHSSGGCSAAAAEQGLTSSGGSSFPAADKEGQVISAAGAVAAVQEEGAPGDSGREVVGIPEARLAPAIPEKVGGEGKGRGRPRKRLSPRPCRGGGGRVGRRRRRARWAAG